MRGVAPLWALIEARAHSYAFFPCVDARLHAQSLFLQIYTQLLGKECRDKVRVQLIALLDEPGTCLKAQLSELVNSLKER